MNKTLSLIVVMSLFQSSPSCAMLRKRSVDSIDFGNAAQGFRVVETSEGVGRRHRHVHVTHKISTPGGVQRDVKVRYSCAGPHSRLRLDVDRLLEHGQVELEKLLARSYQSCTILPDRPVVVRTIGWATYVFQRQLAGLVGFCLPRSPDDHCTNLENVGSSDSTVRVARGGAITLNEPVTAVVGPGEMTLFQLDDDREVKFRSIPLAAGDELRYLELAADLLEQHRIAPLVSAHVRAVESAKARASRSVLDAARARLRVSLRTGGAVPDDRPVYRRWIHGRPVLFQRQKQADVLCSYPLQPVRAAAKSTLARAAATHALHRGSYAAGVTWSETRTIDFDLPVHCTCFDESACYLLQLDKNHNVTRLKIAIPPSRAALRALAKAWHRIVSTPRGLRNAVRLSALRRFDPTVPSVITMDQKDRLYLFQKRGPAPVCFRIHVSQVPLHDGALRRAAAMLESA